MKRFEFRLEKVLVYRRAMADLERARVLLIETELSARRAGLDTLNAKFAQELSTVEDNPIARGELGRYRSMVETERIQLQAAIREKEAALSRQRQIFEKAKQSAELLLKVKTKQMRIWETDLQKEIDSMAMDSYLSRWKSRD